MITPINKGKSATTSIFRIDLAGQHPDQEPEEYFATQLDILILQQYNHNWIFKTITYCRDGWIIVFIDREFEIR